MTVLFGRELSIKDVNDHINMKILIKSNWKVSNFFGNPKFSMKGHLGKKSEC